MWILTLFLIFVALAGIYSGMQTWFRFEMLTKNNVLNTALFVLVVFTIMMIMYVLGFFPQALAAPFMMVLYSLIAGFFVGYGIRLIKAREQAGAVLYQHRSFWADHAPNLLAVALVVYGIYRTAFLSDMPVTGIRLTSGFSLMSFGFFTWTLHVVPEFRSTGILFLDRFIHWKEVIAWSWQSEEVIGIEFVTTESPESERIREFFTSVPADERKEIEIVLKSKMEEFEDDRNNILFNQED